MPQSQRMTRSRANPSRSQRHLALAQLWVYQNAAAFAPGDDPLSVAKSLATLLEKVADNEAVRVAEEYVEAELAVLHPLERAPGLCQSVYPARFEPAVVIPIDFDDADDEDTGKYDKGVLKDLLRSGTG